MVKAIVLVSPWIQSNLLKASQLLYGNRHRRIARMQVHLNGLGFMQNVNDDRLRGLSFP